MGHDQASGALFRDHAAREVVVRQVGDRVVTMIATNCSEGQFRMRLGAAVAKVESVRMISDAFHLAGGHRLEVVWSNDATREEVVAILSLF